VFLTSPPSHLFPPPLLCTTIAPFDALRLLKVLLPYCIDPAVAVSSSQSSADAGPSCGATNTGHGFGSSNMIGKGVAPNIRLVALHVMAETLKHMPSSHLLPGESVLVVRCMDMCVHTCLQEHVYGVTTFRMYHALALTIPPFRSLLSSPFLLSLSRNPSPRRSSAAVALMSRC